MGLKRHQKDEFIRLYKFSSFCNVTFSQGHLAVYGIIANMYENKHNTDVKLS